MSNSHAGPSRSFDSQLSLLGDSQLSLLGLVDVAEAEESSEPVLSAADAEALREERRFRRLLARKERLGDLSGMAACYIRIGDIYLARGDSEEAGEMYRKSLHLARAASKTGASIAPSELL